MPSNVLVILANGFEEIEATVSIDILRRADMTVTIAGLDSLEVIGSHGIIYKSEILLKEFLKPIDALILPGGMPGTVNLMKSESVLTMVKESFQNGALCAAICAAPRVLDSAGILESKSYTCFPGTEDTIKTGNYIKQDVVRDANIITSRGVGTSIPFALEIIDYLLGSEIANSIASKIVYSRHRL